MIGEQKNNVFFRKRTKRFIFLYIVLIFLIGFMIGWVSRNPDFLLLDYELADVGLDIRSYSQRVYFEELFGMDSCDVSTIDEIGQTLWRSGQTLLKLESQSKTNTRQYELLKQRHNVNQVLYYSQLKRFNTNCVNANPVILFFFDSSSPQASEEQGAVLDEIAQETNSTIIAMDYNYTSHISFFYNYYAVGELPYLVLNFNVTYSGMTTKEQILKHLR